MIAEKSTSKYMPLLNGGKKKDPKERLAFVIDMIEKHYEKEVAQDLVDIIKSLGTPVRVSGLCEYGSMAEDEAVDIRFKGGFAVSFFHWGDGCAEKIIKENPMDDECLKDSEVAAYLEGTRLHGFYATANEFNEKHKKFSFVMANKTHFSEGDIFSPSPLVNLTNRLICLSYIGPQYSIAITKYQSKKFR